MRNLLTLILISLSLSAVSQSIVNSEKALPNADRKFAMSSDISSSSSVGNVNIFRLNSGLNIGMKLDTNNTLRLISGLTMLHQNSNVIKDIGYAQLRHNFIISSRIKLFNFYQAQFNNNLLLEHRQLLGSGMRFKVTPSDSSRVRFYLLVGAMYEVEQLNASRLPLNEITNTNLVRSATSAVVRYDKNNFHVVTITYYQAHLLDIDDFRLLNDTEVTLDINKKLSVSIIFQYKYDSRPPSILVSHDYLNSFGLTYKI